MIRPLCPCGHDFVPEFLIAEEMNGYVTYPNREYPEIIAAEVRCRELGPEFELPGGDDPRTVEFRERLWFIIERSGSLLECPECGCVLWKRSAEEGFRVFRPAPLTAQAEQE
jgi:hypothetical protein